MSLLDTALQKLLASQGSEMIFRTNAPVYFRIGNQLVRQELPLPNEEEMDRSLKQVAGAERLAELHRTGETHMLHRAADGERYRVTAFQQRGTPGLVVRHLPKEAPAFESLGTPEIFNAIPRLRRGLVILSGSAGSGKSTTLASLLGELVQIGPIRILTFEDPVEFKAPAGPALVTQREVGRDVETFAAGLRAARHQDPDIVLIGNIPDAEALDQALTLAASGPLVYMVMTAGSTIRALERTLDYFPADQRELVLERLATSLRGVLGQHLLSTEKGAQRVPAFELLVPGPEIRKCIRQDRLSDVPGLMERSRGCVPLRQSVGLLLKSKRIPLDEAERLFPELRKKG